MFKLVFLLAGGMFLTLLIGGEDKGQMRQGLMDAPQSPVPQPSVERTALSKPKAEPATDRTLVTFTPVTVQKPAVSPAPTSAVAGAFVVSAPENTEVAAAEPQITPEVTPNTGPDLSVMYVSSRSVNVRSGPSTDYEVVDRLSRAEAVTVVSAEEDGWVRIRIEGDGIEGFIAARLLSDTDPTAN